MSSPTNMPIAQAPPPAYPPAYPPAQAPPTYAGYAQPGYPPQPPPYYGAPYGPPAYYAPVYAQPIPDHTMSSVAGLMWIGCLVRDLLYLIGLLVVGGVVGAFGFGVGAIILAFALFPIIGIIGSILAMTSDFQRRNHSLGTVGAVLALIGSSFPGILVIGPIGLAFSVIGLLLHVMARREFPMG